MAGVGPTRARPDVHWPTDVLGSCLLGTLTVTLAAATHTHGPGSRTEPRIT
ncbi:hypothetical protein [Streptomyces sp. KN37]|uniref:hypothetical protein n=1 Tax=Streptomyces sp. KN37 TaxID=3090667 RepID=UPI002A74A854|nr:hypothetical protein [Streptomyces sp. KN37]WPO76172.1 hypothetical protein R9806_33680 [Streptomyces sp. KN37]